MVKISYKYWIRIITEIQWLLPWPVCVPPFHRILTKVGFCVVLLTNKQTDADENITSLVEVINTEIIAGWVVLCAMTD